MRQLHVQRNEGKFPAGVLKAAFVGAILSTLCLAAPTAQAQDTPATPQTGNQPTPATPATPAPTGTQTPTPPPPPPPDDKASHHHFTFGPELGVYFPTSSKTQQAFGSESFSIGVGLGGIQNASYKGRFQIDLGLFGQSRGNNSLYMAPVGVSYRRALSQNVAFGPYIGASADLFLTQIRDDSDGIISRVRGAGGGSVFIGTRFSHSAYVQARYFLVSDVRGFDLSGVNLTTGYRF